MTDKTTEATLDETLEMAENEHILGENSTKIAEVEAQLADQKDKYLRLAAEFDNFRKRTARESLDLRATAGREILSALLPIADDFDRAAANGALSEGVQFIHQKFQNLLHQKGLRAMDSTGADFDPDNHEAIAEIPAANEEMKGKIIDTVEKGYTLNDVKIRVAKVVVGK